jgi:O-antigen/teichoic acid export membrane protein
VGPFVGHLLFRAKFELGNLDLALLAAGSGMFIFALTMSQGLIALDALGQVLVSWLVGVVAFIVATLVSSTDLFTRVEIGSIVGAGAAALTMSLMFVRQLRKGIDRTSLAALVEQIEHEPLEI